MIETCRRVQASGAHNYEKCKILLPSTFNFDFIEKHLSDYPDPNLIPFLKYGFPLGNTLGLGSHEIPNNHGGATNFETHMTKLLQQEVQHGAALGPFREPILLNSCFSPLNSVPKKDSDDRRLILDLSMPEGNSINDGIDKDYCFGNYDKLSLPSVDHLAHRISILGPKCKVFKVDLVRAFRQMKICPGDVHFLGYVFKGKFYYDCTLSMGSKSSSKACQYVTTAVVFIYTKFGYFAVNYLDDLGSAEDADAAETAYAALLELLDNFGLQPALHKCVPPCTSMVFLGIEVNTVNMTLKIPEAKWAEINRLLTHWQSKEKANRHDVQVLAGHLNFACRCVKSGRIYLSRILNFLRSLPRFQARNIPDGVKLDVQWWIDLAPLYNGVTLITEAQFSDADSIMSSDSCLTGGGAFMEGAYITWQYPPEVREKATDINQLEFLMLLIATKVWSHKLHRKKFVVNCDNKNTVLAINSGASKDPTMQLCLRELHKTTALISCELQARFISGKSNRISDHLSRVQLHKKHLIEFHRLTEGYVKKQYYVHDHQWAFFIK